MGSFSVTGMDVTIGDWHWGAEARDQQVPAVVAHVVQRGFEGARLARRASDDAMALALGGAFREERRLPTIRELRTDERPPALAVELHDLQVAFELPSGASLTVRGRDTLPRIEGAEATPSMYAAARFAHRLAWREAYAALLDASARVGGFAPTPGAARAEALAVEVS